MQYIKIKNGKTLLIRKPTVDDAEKIIKYLNQVGGESDFLLFGKNEFRLSIEQEKKFIENFNKQSNSLMLIGEIKGEIISISQISSPTKERIKHTSEVAISVLRDYWGNGVGSAIMKSLIEFVHKTKVIKVINLQVHRDNTRAIKLYKKYGFKEIGIYKKYFCINGKYYDSMIMNLYIDN